MSKRIVIAHLLWEGKDYLVHTLAEGERPVELTALCREKETLLGNIYAIRSNGDMAILPAFNCFS